MNREQLIEALKQLGRGRIDAAEAIAEYFLPAAPAVELVELPVVEQDEPKAE